MSFDELCDRVLRRVIDYDPAHGDDIVLSEAALADAAELWQAAQPADPEHPTPEDDLRLAAARQALGALHYERHTALPPGPDQPELARAIVFLASPGALLPEPLRAVLGPTADPDRQADLAVSMLAHAEASVDEYFLNAAISLLAAAVAAAPADHPHRALYLTRLGVAYMRRFERGGMLADLERAIESGEQAVTTGYADRSNLAMYLSNLGTAYMRRFERGGTLADLEHAIDNLEQAVAATPPGHYYRGMYLSNLGTAYRWRSERGGVLADLDRAIEVGEQAVAATAADHPGRAMYLSNLGTAYMRRFERGGTLADLDHAIDNCQRAVAATPEDHPDLAKWLSNLGIAYVRRFERGGVLADVERAIETFEQVVVATAADHPDFGRWLSNLGSAYLDRFEHGGVLGDLEHAIDNLERAVAATPADHPDRAGWLSNLGNAYLSRIDVGGRAIDPETLRTLAGQVAATSTAPPAARAHAGQAAGSLAHAVGQDTLAVQLLDAAVAVLPLVVPRESGWADQEYRLSMHQGLVGEAVAAHCAIDDPVGAVQAAEMGRGILLAAQMDSRTDLTTLDHAHPELAARFREIRDKLNDWDAMPETPVDPAAQIEERKRQWADYDRLLTQIRQQPDSARFLLPPLFTDLQPAAAGGAVVLVNTGRRRSDAIIITADANPLHIPLPDLTPTDVQSQAMALLAATHNDSPISGITRRQHVVPEVLGWLWDTVVKPILDALPPPPGRTSSLPRVWWLPTGLLGLFPLHAAGRPGQLGALERILSSYAPTLRTLAYVRRHPPATSRRQLTVALHHTPGLPDLPSTVAEATAVSGHDPGTPELIDQDATTNGVLTALRDTTWAHFACHATADLTAPSQSGLCLYDGTLPIPEISRLQLTEAELAYLSACSTANRGWRLADESLHLASAFQMAGFRHVIASLWPLDDHFAATTAAAFYQHLLPSTPTADEPTPSGDKAAAALHDVTRDLRALYPDRPDVWAALIHSGP